MKLSRRSMLRIAGSSGLAVVAGSALAVSQETPAYAAQSKWRWCWKCQGLWFSGHPTMGVCPVSEFGHDYSGSGNYSLLLDSDPGSGQTNWRWCWKCQGLWFSGHPTMGVCPVSEFGHDYSGSGNYKIEFASVGGGQSKWRWCWKCQGLWFSGHPTMGVCPVSEFGHDYSGSGNYQLRQV